MNILKLPSLQRFHLLVTTIALSLAIVLSPPGMAADTIGGGTIASPAVGPAPSFGIGGKGFVLVKNWEFGTNGTITNISDLNANFQYHDQFNGIGPDLGYGAKCVAPDSADAIAGQPIENVDTATPVRTFFANSMQTYLVPLDGATTVTPSSANAGSGSFMAKWSLPGGGATLNEDVIWETRVRYVTPPYFWFAIWTAGNQWDHGAEMDLIESFGFDNTPVGGGTNYDGHLWHSNSVGGSDATNYSNWGSGMGSSGITSYDATQWHTWDWVYHTNNTYNAYVDGIPVQSGTLTWTLGAKSNGNPINMDFLFDGTWANTGISSVDHSLPASSLAGTYYEWNYSRVYLRSGVTVDSEDTGPTVSITGSWSPSTSVAGYLGTNYLTDGNTGKGTKSVEYLPALPSNTSYQVFLRWTALSNRATNVPVDILKADGTTSTVVVDQTKNGGAWNLLGTYSLSTANAALTIRTTGTNNYVIADAAQFVPLPQVIVDNDDTASVTITGSWNVSTSGIGYLGNDYLTDGNTGKGTKSVSFNPTLGGNANYQVYLMWPANTNRATNVPVYILKSDGTTALVVVDETKNGGAWNLLGTYPLSTTNASVTIQTAGTNGYVIANAALFIPQ